MGFFSGSKPKTVTKEIYTPEQRAILDQIRKGISGPMGSGIENIQNILGGDEDFWKKWEAPARQSFEQQTLPSIAERFTGDLGEGSNRSSAFGQTLGAAGSDLEQNLMRERQEMQSGAMNQLMNLLMPQAMAPLQYEYQKPGREGFGRGFGKGIMGGLGAFGGSLFPGMGSSFGGMTGGMGGPGSSGGGFMDFIRRMFGGGG